jgi:hypothetical protein
MFGLQTIFKVSTVISSPHHLLSPFIKGENHILMNFSFNYYLCFWVEISVFAKVNHSSLGIES